MVALTCRSAGLAVLGALMAPAFAAAGACHLGRIAEFPVTVSDLRPLMMAKVNGTDVRFLVDSGAFYSVISPASAAELHLPSSPGPFGFFLTGIGGGSASVSIATVKELTLAGVPLHNVEFLVGGTAAGDGSIGVLGQNVLHIADVEYDFGHGAIRLMKALDCRSDAMLAYWVVGTTMPYSTLKIQPTTPQEPFAIGHASINGTEIRVMFDSGAGVSTLSLRAAARVGIKPDSPGVVPAGVIWGFGKTRIPSYIAPFSSFKLGEEEIRHTRLRIADIDLPDADMLIGPDFFLSHRIYVANSRHTIFFTYSGGPVFNLEGVRYAAPGPSSASAAQPAPDAPPPAAAGAPPSPGTPPSPGAPATQAHGDEGGDAADFSRRGAAMASRRDYAHALIALSRACELAPDNAEYLYQRGMIHWQMQDEADAMQDLDRALKLEPAYVAALLSHAELSLQRGDNARATADLEAADGAASKQADLRYQIGLAYERADLLGPAIAQYDLWIAAHPEDARLPYAQNSRCWARALGGTDLALALKDCDAALKRADKGTGFYARAANSRALVRLRMGKYGESIADYNAAIKIDPKDPWAWYGRGIDEQRMKMTGEAQVDIAQAEALSPKIAEQFNRHGLSP